MNVTLQREVLINREVRLLVETIVLLKKGVEALVVLLDLTLEDLGCAKEGCATKSIVREGAGGEENWRLVGSWEQFGKGVEGDSIQ